MFVFVHVYVSEFVGVSFFFKANLLCVSSFIKKVVFFIVLLFFVCLACCVVYVCV